MILGGSGSGSEGGGDFDGTGVAKSCSDHKTKEECFGPMIEIVNGTPVKGECVWKVIPALKYAGCVFEG